MRYAILLLTFLVVACGRTPDGRIVASTTLCGPTGPVAGCPGYRGDQPTGGEQRVRKRIPNHECSITSDRLGVGRDGRGIRLSTRPITLPHGPFGEDRYTHLEVDCCDLEGRYRGYYLNATPRGNRDLVVPDDFQPRAGWAPNAQFCRELGLMS